MFESTIVRSAIIIYALLASFSLVLLWKNAAAPNALQNSGIVVASILPILISVLPYLNTKDQVDHFNFILLYDSQARSITRGELNNAYYSTYLYMFSNLNEVPSYGVAEDLNEFQEKGLDIIEKGIIESLQFRFVSHWDVQWKENRGPNYTSYTSGGGNSEGSEEVTNSYIRNLFNHNKLLSCPSVLSPQSFHIPPNGKLTATQSNNNRTINLLSNYGDITISIQKSSAGVIQNGLWGILKGDPGNINRYYSASYGVLLTFSPNKFKQYSPEMKPYVSWYKNIKDVLAKYDWNEIDKSVEHQLLRKSISSEFDR